MRRALVGALVVASVGMAVSGFVIVRNRHVEIPAPVSTASSAPPVQSEQAPPQQETAQNEDDPNDLHFRTPDGSATHVTCEEAHRIVSEVRKELAYEHDRVDEKEFAASVGDWLDPHSFWSLPEDAPTQDVIDANAKKLIAELEGRGAHPGSCDTALTVGKSLAGWSKKLRANFEAGRAHPSELPRAEEHELPSSDKTESRAEEIGRRAQAFRVSAGPDADAYVNAARDRFFPDYDERDWADIVLAAAVRAYVPIVDPHGAWAPLEEKASVYEVDLFAAPPEKPWGKVTVTAVGFRVEDSATAPLHENDVVLRVNDVLTAGMPLEQIEQLGYTSRKTGSAKIIVARDGKIISLDVPDRPFEKLTTTGAAPSHLAIERIPFGSEEVALIAFQDVKDDLGDDIHDVLMEISHEKIAGIVIDLRGNGGGSTDGAINALGFFIPNAPLFPTKRRDGTIEIDRAPSPAHPWEGPVATLVDGATASAAEMISGALMAYGRAPSVGALTFGKGCAQEYLDDEPAVGVLRLTTLLYALPDGTPVQRVGLTPSIKLPFVVKTDDANEREATLKHTAPTWRGPDVHNPALFPHKESWAWPSSGGKVGPCEDADVCHALRALGSRRPQIAKNKTDAH